MRIRCKVCRRILKVPDKVAGKRVVCPKCSTKLIVPLLMHAGSVSSGDLHSPVPLPSQSKSALTAPTQVHEPRVATDRNGSHLTPEFLQNLRCVYRTLPQNRDPAECIPVLIGIFESQRRKDAERASSFRADLERVYLETSPYSDEYLPAITARFESLRAQVRCELAEQVKDLWKEDPLYCPVSLFGVMGQARLETAHTAVLAWLLDPRREHGFGTCLLRSLLDYLRKTSGSDISDVEEAVAEYRIENGCRLDVMVRGKGLGENGESWLIVIEAKIDANEGEQQLSTYDEWVNKNQEDRVFRVFLTPEGRAPETSASVEAWIPLSFAELARVFRSRCRELETCVGYPFLRYYLAGVLRDICHWNLPVQDPETCRDPYSFLEYLKADRPT